MTFFKRWVACHLVAPANGSGLHNASHARDLVHAGYDITLAGNSCTDSNFDLLDCLIEGHCDLLRIRRSQAVQIGIIESCFEVLGAHSSYDGVEGDKSHKWTTKADAAWYNVQIARTHGNLAYTNCFISASTIPSLERPEDQDLQPS